MENFSLISGKCGPYMRGISVLSGLVSGHCSTLVASLHGLMICNSCLFNFFIFGFFIAYVHNSPV